MKWLLIQPDEDGNPCSWLNERELATLLADPRGTFGVRTFLDRVPDETDPNYWPEGSALLLSVAVVVPRPVTTAYELP